MTVIVFGSLYLLSYAMILLLYSVMGSGAAYAAGASGPAADLLDLFAPVIPMVALGVLMLLAVFHRWAFHALAIYVLVTQGLCLVAALMAADNFLAGSSSPLFGFAGENNMMMFLGRLADWLAGSNLTPDLASVVLASANLLFWLLPFVVYYALRLRARLRARKDAPTPSAGPHS
jgi:hypothetical protein